MTSAETRLIRQTANRIRQALLAQATEVERGEAVHQGLTATNVALIQHYERQLGIYRAVKELLHLIHNEIDATDELISAYQSAEGHSYEALQDSRQLLHDFQNLATVAGNLEPVLMARIEGLKADV